MTQRVTLPNGDYIDFPDGTSPQEMTAAINRKDTPWYTDMAKAAAVAPAKAAAGLAGFAGDVRDLSSAGKNKILSYLPDWVRQADTAVSRFTPPTPLDAVKLAPTSGDIRRSAEQYTGPWYDPVTRAGKVADTFVQTGLLGGRNWITNPLSTLALTGGVTAGTETAGAATGDDPWARLLGGLVGGGLPAAANALKTKVGSQTRQALGELTPAQIDAAISMQQDALSRGTPLMGTESLDRGAQLASTVLAHPSGNQTVENFLRQRPSQVKQAFERDVLAETGPLGTPMDNASRAQNAATKVVQNAERSRTTRTKPLFDAAAADQVPAADVQAIVAAARTGAKNTDPEYAAALSKFASDLLDKKAAVPASAVLGPNGQPLFPAIPASTVPRTDVGPLSDTFKRVRDSLDVPAINASSEDRIAKGILGPYNQQLKGALESASPQWQNANNVYKAITENEINPLTSGPVGIVAGRTGFDPSSPTPVPRVNSVVSDANTVRPESIRTLYTNLNAVDKQAFPGIAQTHFENALNVGTKPLQTGPNPAAGAKLNNILRGTDIEKQNFNEIMRGVALAQGKNPDDVVRGANTLMDILERQGRTPGIGSATATRGEYSKELGQTMIGDTLSMVSLTPLKPAARRYDNFIVNRRYSTLANALTAPDSVEQLVKLAKYKPNSLTATYLVSNMLGLGATNAAQ